MAQRVKGKKQVSFVKAKMESGLSFLAVDSQKRLRMNIDDAGEEVDIRSGEGKNTLAVLSKRLLLQAAGLDLETMSAGGGKVELTGKITVEIEGTVTEE
jgi:hypothetical protein